jgi:hypothetical protein
MLAVSGRRGRAERRHHDGGTKVDTGPDESNSREWSPNDITGTIRLLAGIHDLRCRHCQCSEGSSC